MTTVTPEQIAAAVSLAIAKATSMPYPNEDGIFEDVDSAVGAAVTAQREYMKCSMNFRRRVVQAIRDFTVIPENLHYMAEEAVKQTGMGNVPDKILKNKFVAELTPGVEDLFTEAWSGDDGLTTLELSPFGVIGAITPTTNPTETILCNGIAMLAAGNAVVFSPHPRAKDLSIWLVKELNHALAKIDAPANLITMVREPSIENTDKLMAHKDVRLLVATGGPGIVRTVLSSGKKAIGAGAGNPPVVVDETADIEQAAKDIVDGATFDNNLPCTAEKEVIAVDAIADLLKFNMLKNGAFELTDPGEIAKLQELVMDGKLPRTEWVGKSALSILKALGIKAPSNTRLITMETELMHPFVLSELMMPILPIVRAKNVDEAIDWAIICEHNLRHTAIMHSTNVTSLTKMARLIQTTIFVKNGPSYSGIGIGGEGFITFTIAGPTGEGLTSARTFTRKRRCVLVGGLNVR
ncbi:MAG: aldehyde dehydrogenase EutE [Propionibacteriaceae bacterium]|jgi:propionaldehyde dehydrogenase|nr:aldehyde dehydrogenase EutE [Propionibacteriaceae bacterium]